MVEAVCSQYLLLKPKDHPALMRTYFSERLCNSELTDINLSKPPSFHLKAASACFRGCKLNVWEATEQQVSSETQALKLKVEATNL